MCVTAANKSLSVPVCPGAGEAAGLWEIQGGAGGAERHEGPQREGDPESEGAPEAGHGCTAGGTAAEQQPGTLRTAAAAAAAAGANAVVDGWEVLMFLYLYVDICIYVCHFG